MSYNIWNERVYIYVFLSLIIYLGWIPMKLLKSQSTWVYTVKYLPRVLFHSLLIPHLELATIISFMFILSEVVYAYTSKYMYVLSLCFLTQLEAYFFRLFGALLFLLNNYIFIDCLHSPSNARECLFPYTLLIQFINMNILKALAIYCQMAFQKSYTS